MYVIINQSRNAVWHAHIGDLLHASCIKVKKKKLDNEMGEIKLSVDRCFGQCKTSTLKMGNQALHVP